MRLDDVAGPRDRIGFDDLDAPGDLDAPRRLGRPDAPGRLHTSAHLATPSDLDASGQLDAPGDLERGLTFAPVPIGPGRRSLERTLVLVVAVVAVLGLAIAKPWAGSGPAHPGESAVVAGSSPAVATAVEGPETATRSPGAPTRPVVPPARSLADVADWWAVLGTDYGFVSGRLVGVQQAAPGAIVSTLTIWRQRPTMEPLAPEGLGPDGSPAAVVPIDTTVIGVTVPRAETPDSIVVWRLFAANRRIELPVRPMPLGDRGIWLLSLPEGATWEPGLYAVGLVGPTGPRWLNVCVASRPVGLGGPVLDPADWSLEAYEEAVRAQANLGPADGRRADGTYVGRLPPLARRAR